MHSPQRVDSTPALPVYLPAVFRNWDRDQRRRASERRRRSEDPKSTQTPPELPAAATAIPHVSASPFSTFGFLPASPADPGYLDPPQSALLESLQAGSASLQNGDAPQRSLEELYNEDRHFRPLSELMASDPGEYVAPTLAQIQQALKDACLELEERATRLAATHDVWWHEFCEMKAEKGESLETEWVGTGRNRHERLVCIREWMAYLWDKLPKYILKGFRIKKETRVSMCHCDNKTSGQKCKHPLICKFITRFGSFRFYDEDDKLFWYKLENGNNEYARGTSSFSDGVSKHAQHWKNQEIDDKFVEEWFPNGFENDWKNKKVPESKDARHPDDQHHEKEKEWSNTNGFPMFNCHFGIWCETGGMNQATSTAGPWGSFIAEDSKGGKGGPAKLRNHRIPIAEVYCEDIARTEAAMGGVHCGADEPGFEIQRAHCQFMVDEGTGLRKYNDLQTGCMLARVGQKHCRTHKDGGDAKGHLVSTCCMGLFSGAHLCYPGIDERVAMLPDDIVGCLAGFVDHMVLPFVGKRTCWVSTSKSDATTIKQPLRLLTNPVEIRSVEAKEVARKATKAVVRTKIVDEESILVEAWTKKQKGNISQVDAILLRWIYTYPRKTLQAKKAKREAIAAVAGAGKSKVEIKKLEQTPAALFYPLLARERKMIERGETEAEKIFLPQERLIDGVLIDKPKNAGKAGQAGNDENSEVEEGSQEESLDEPAAKKRKMRK